MSRYKVSYGRCKKSTFLSKKRAEQLVPGRIYFIKDTGQILRANSTSEYDSYSDQIHVVDNFPIAGEYIEHQIYIKKSTGRAKVMSGDIIYELKCSGVGSSGDSSADISELEADIASIKDQLTWQVPEE